MHGLWFNTVGAIGKPERQVCNASHCGSKLQQIPPDMITLLLLLCATYICVLFFAHIQFVVSRTFNAMPTGRLQQHPLIFTTSTLVTCSYCEGCTWHDLHNLVTAPLCCDQKARAATVQSFTPWQQATIEIHLTRSRYYCLFKPYIWYIYGRYSSCTSHSWWITHSMECQPKGCNAVQQGFAELVRLPVSMRRMHGEEQNLNSFSV